MRRLLERPSRGAVPLRRTKRLSQVPQLVHGRLELRLAGLKRRLCLLFRSFARTTPEHDKQCDDDSDNKGEQQLHAQSIARLLSLSASGETVGGPSRAGDSLKCSQRLDRPAIRCARCHVGRRVAAARVIRAAVLQRRLVGRSFFDGRGRIASDRSHGSLATRIDPDVVARYEYRTLERDQLDVPGY